MRLALALVMLASPALAEPPLTAEEFDSLTQGRIMTWSEFGTVYGVEQYLPGRRVRWTVMGDECKAGHWYAEGSAICFQYEDDHAPDCWDITRSATGLIARYTTNPPDAEPVVVEDTTESLACFGPKVGA
jgi:hypothetical protein